MNLTQAVAAMRSYFAAGWGNLSTIIHDDEKKDKPTEASWVRLNIRHNVGSQSTAGDPGNNRYVQMGFITAQIFTPQGDASITNRALADAALALFMGKQTQGISFFNVTAREIGNDGNGWYQTNVIAEFRYDRFA